MVYKWDIHIGPLSPQLRRRAYLCLPEGYDDNPHQRFPVLYMFDGQNVFFDSDATFGKSWGMAKYMEETRTPLIIAAVECNSVGNGRIEEYSPFGHTTPKLGTISPHGRTMMNWLVREFKPMIDANLRTLPDRSHTLIAGSSLGGLMSLYAATAYNRYFSRAACLSPSLWLAPEKARRMIKAAEIDPDTQIYMDYGGDEMGNHPGNPEALSSAAMALLRKRVDLTLRIVPGGTHCEASWERQIPVFMKCLGF